MICKSCGAKLEAGSDVCPNCRKKVPPDDGGNGFWDMVSGKPKKEPPNPPKFGLSLYAICFSCILSVASIIIAFVVINRVNSGFDATMRKINGFEAYVQTSIGMVDANVQEVSHKIDGLDFTPTPSEPNVEIRGVVFEYALENYIGLPIIQFKLAESVTAVAWEKQDANGLWHTVEFDDGKNEQYGFELLENPESNEYGLIAGTISEETAGVYRFTMLQENGEAIFTGVLPLRINNFTDENTEVVEKSLADDAEIEPPSETEGTLELS